jgi:type 1 fimbriae regulatory protein FimB
MRATSKVIPIQAPAGPPKEPAPRKARRRKDAPLFLQEDELARFFKAIAAPRDRAIFRLMYHAGLRASEVGRLELRDYNARTDRIYIERLKGSNSGEHHLCREEAKALKAWLKIRGQAPGALFPSKKGSAIDRRMLWVLVRKYGRLAGLPPRLCHPHVFKHTCCTHLMSKGFNVEQVQDWVGHANIQNTLKYGKITNRRRDEMAGALKDSWR